MQMISDIHFMNMFATWLAHTHKHAPHVMYFNDNYVATENGVK